MRRLPLPLIRPAQTTWALGLLTCAALASSAAAGAGTARLALGAATIASVAHLAVLFGAPSPTRRTAAAAVAVALTAHVLLLAAPPLFSDDVYRYAFDGTLSRHGLAPWAWAPSSPKVLDLGGEIVPHINHPELPTIYPPVAQAAFAIGAFPAAPVLGIRVLMWLAMLAGCALLPDRRHGLAVVTHPLVALSVAGDGHVDALAVPLVALALRAGTHRPGRLGAALGLAASVKFFPAALGLAAVGRAGVRRAAIASAVAIGVLGATYLPVAHMGAKALGSLQTYATTWRFHGALEPAAASVVAVGLDAAGVPDPVEVPWESRQRERRDDPRWIDGQPFHVGWRSHGELARAATKALGALAFAGVALVLARRQASLPVAGSALTLALLATSPVVHPWYGLWLLPWALAARDRTALVACATLVLGFHAAAAELDGGAWNDAIGWRLGTWLPVAIAFVVARRRTGTATEPASLTAR